MAINSRRAVYNTSQLSNLISIVPGELPDFEKVKVTMAKWLDTG